jgi:hypothetical protein
MLTGILSDIWTQYCDLVQTLEDISSLEMSESMIREVPRLALSPNKLFQKCFGTTTVRVCRQHPEFSNQFQPITATVLNHPIHTILTAGVHLSRLRLKCNSPQPLLWIALLIPFRKVLEGFLATR